MCELLVRVTDKVNSDFYLDTKCTKRGDVVAVCEDGWPWSERERTAPHWRIIALPQVPMVEAEPLLTPEKDTDPVQPSRTLQIRAIGFDLDNLLLPAEFRAYLSDAKRTAGTFTLQIDIATFRLLRKPKLRIADPGVIGLDPNVIG